jgi:copper chaperone NosL
MRPRLGNCVFVVTFVALLLGCERRQPSTPPPPQDLTGEEIGYFCKMVVVEHKGPKGQIFLDNVKAPLWFTSVRDTLAFTRLPDEPKDIRAIYVTDEGAASWDHPEPGTWVDATRAWYVIDSDKRGGMGAPEVVPFRERVAAVKFSEMHHGRVVDYASVPIGNLLGSGTAGLK